MDFAGSATTKANKALHPFVLIALSINEQVSISSRI
jgi:hypothetical protein